MQALLQPTLQTAGVFCQGSGHGNAAMIKTMLKGQLLYPFGMLVN
jgi:hypothetical protein